MTPRSRSLAVATLALLVTIVGVATPGWAQGKATAAADMKELASYRLTMDLVNRVARATSAMAPAMKDAPDLFSDEQSLGDMEKVVKQVPAMVDALGKENITPREYAKFTLAMIQASLAAALQKGGSPLPESVAPENVKFVIDHEAEIQKIQQSMWGGAAGN